MDKQTDYDLLLTIAKQSAHYRQQIEERAAQGLAYGLSRRSAESLDWALDLIASIDDDYAEDVAEARRAAKPERPAFRFDSGGGLDHSRMK